ncbi:MAG: hypothetical protein NC225_00940 [Clostridium sp.]|nr:hypothetical protein [Clostridium sp.]MCM1398026.1 hypothetical protein [Clostridium sp.]MCM1459338.1 hypothetical protein [Bacteroides sp.]
MNSDLRKRIRDIKKETNQAQKFAKYADCVKEHYNYYAAVKLSMNYYTIREMVEERSGISPAVKKHLEAVTALLKQYVVSDGDVADSDIDRIKGIRSDVERRMQILTSYTDGYEIYEYILNRIEAGIKEKLEDVDVDELSSKVFQYIFADMDKVVINSKLQLVMSQLPVRMTKAKFYDVVTNTLNIYKGGDKKAVAEFVDMLEKTALIALPPDFEQEYPVLYSTYHKLKETDYKNADAAAYDSLCEGLADAVSFIENESTFLVLFQEIVNDTFALLLTNNKKDANKNKNGYQPAIHIMSTCAEGKTIDMEDQTIMDAFISIEGVQEELLESVYVLETMQEEFMAFIREDEDIRTSGEFQLISTLDKLLSTSLFISLEEENDLSGVADGAYITTLRKSLTDKLSGLFDSNPMIVNRSIMSKLLSVMPIFLNSKQEIKSYLDYVLGNCRDMSELTACNRLLNELIEEE